MITSFRGKDSSTAHQPVTQEVLTMCNHSPACPTSHSPDARWAHAVRRHPEQGWDLLCNGVVLFYDGGALLPTGEALPPRRRAVDAA